MDTLGTQGLGWPIGFTRWRWQGSLLLKNIYKHVSEEDVWVISLGKRGRKENSLYRSWRKCNCLAFYTEIRKKETLVAPHWDLPKQCCRVKTLFYILLQKDTTETQRVELSLSKEESSRFSMIFFESWWFRHLGMRTFGLQS